MMEVMKQSPTMIVISQSAIRYRFKALMCGLVSLNTFLFFLIDAGLNRTKEHIRIAIRLFELYVITQELNHVG
jgi:hypothetical protein